MIIFLLFRIFRADNSASTCHPTEQFGCLDGICIPQSWVCDDFNDCLAHDDESDCFGLFSSSYTYFSSYSDCFGFGCSSSYDGDSISYSTCFECLDGDCIPQVWVCDSIPDCMDNGDESNCTNGNDCINGGDGDNCIGKTISPVPLGEGNSTTICSPQSSPGKYPPYQNKEWQFVAKGFLLQFSHFELEKGYDFLHIYNSLTENGQEFEEIFTGNNYDNKTVRVFSRPFLRLIFTSDGSVQMSGFCADIFSINTSSTGKS
ncbi:Low-density lipoprotein receptor-related protein 2 [Holothuria leucospilota]|uniref:Low-density lipoprotein receptor-related protein 2 n=1 Tax=Holothuria leucospilota TaxID=206669 RepID=A0A9Q0YR74_HOLLE|nr:Low-density lipoprotein receptor-related protein 2 [Holothuria leucospilota]